MCVCLSCLCVSVCCTCCWQSGAAHGRACRRGCEQEQRIQDALISWWRQWWRSGGQVLQAWEQVVIVLPARCWSPTLDHVTRPSRHTCCCHAQKQSPAVPIQGHAHARPCMHTCMLQANPSVNLLLLDVGRNACVKTCTLPNRQMRMTALTAAGAHAAPPATAHAQPVSSCKMQCQPCNNCVSEQQHHALHKSTPPAGVEPGNMPAWRAAAPAGQHTRARTAFYLAAVAAAAAVCFGSASLISSATGIKGCSAPPCGFTSSLQQQHTCAHRKKACQDKDAACICYRPRRP